MDVRDGSIFAAGTLFMEGEPVRVPQVPVFHGDIVSYSRGAKLSFGPAVGDPEYTIYTIAVGGVFIADRVLLSDISYADIKASIR